MTHYSTYQSQFIEMFGQVSEESPCLNDIAHVYDGTHKTPTYANSGIPFISVENISDVYGSKKYISKDDYDLYKHKPEYGDIFMTRIGSIGKCAVYESHDPLAYYVSLALIKPNKDIVHPKFLKYYIESTDGTLELKKRSLLKAFPMKINLGEIGKIKVIVPAKDKQLEFVKVAEQADKSKFTSLKSQFIEMFGSIAENSKHLPQKKLGEVATLLNGRAYKANELLSQGKYIVLRVGNFFTNADYYYSDMELDPDKYCDTGDLLYSWSATLGAQIWSGEKVIYHYHIWKVVFDEAVLNKKYFCYMLNYMTDALKQETHGSTMVHLTKEGMEKKLIVVPSLEDQNKFSNILEQADKSKSIN